MPIPKPTIHFLQRALRYNGESPLEFGRLGKADASFVTDSSRRG